jgi:DNA-binding GntR family transcriptional regulator
MTSCDYSIPIEDIVMPKSSKSSQPRPVRHEISEHLVRAILSGQVGLGKPLSQDAIKKCISPMFKGRRRKMPHMAIREAMLILEEQRLIEIIPQQGTFLRVPDSDEIHEIQDARRLIEQSIACKLASMPSPKLDRALNANRRMKEIAEARREQDLYEFVEQDDRFHFELAAAAGFPNTLAQTVIQLRNRLRLVVLPSAKSFGSDTVREHDEILQSIQDQQPLADVRRVVANHLNMAMHRWKSRVGLQLTAFCD